MIHDPDYARELEQARVQSEMYWHYMRHPNPETSYIMETIENDKEPGGLWHTLMSALEMSKTDSQKSGQLLYTVYREAAMAIAERKAEEV